MINVSIFKLLRMDTLSDPYSDPLSSSASDMPIGSDIPSGMDSSASMYQDSAVPSKNIKRKIIAIIVIILFVAGSWYLYKWWKAHSDNHGGHHDNAIN